DITPVGPESQLRQDGVRIGIFMNICDVHVNRSPCDAMVERIEHCRGVFLDARNPAASERNESATIHMMHVHNGLEHPVVVRQVAGLIARRIVTDLSEGQDISRGQRIGMIKFGSRLEVLVPRGLVGRVCVRHRQRVRAGLTVLLTTPDVGETGRE
ncbi:MAG: phosphatidylserine decarboxylase, partial [Planctomycetota bacterium]|nr:phosphatidylserine decarboxylase [Planctomycetota bacterium]